MIDAIKTIVPVLQIGLLLLAGWNDLVARTVPDRLCLALAAAGLLVRAVAGPVALAASGAIAALLFLALLPVHARGGIGGGDIKLAAALVLGLPAPGAYHFLIITGLSGGVLALLHLALRRLPPAAPCPAGASLPRRVWTVERWRLRRKGSLPYGIAITCGGIWAVVSVSGG